MHCLHRRGGVFASLNMSVLLLFKSSFSPISIAMAASFSVASKFVCRCFGKPVMWERKWYHGRRPAPPRPEGISGSQLPLLSNLYVRIPASQLLFVWVEAEDRQDLIRCLSLMVAEIKSWICLDPLSSKSSSWFSQPLTHIFKERETKKVRYLYKIRQT